MPRWGSNRVAPAPPDSPPEGGRRGSHTSHLSQSSTDVTDDDSLAASLTNWNVPPRLPRLRVFVLSVWSQPVFCPREVREAWEWRVRNLPYPTETYSMTLDEEKDQLAE